MVLYRFALALVALWLRLATRRGGTARERLDPPAPRTFPCLWVHGASNGEMTGARGAIDGLVARGHALIITTNSETARTMVQGWSLPRAEVRLAPLDDRATVRRFLDAARPAALIVIENELWPERLLAAAARGIPVFVLGARLSAKSARLWSRFPRLAGRMMAAIRWLAPQDEASAARFAALGLAPDRTGPVLSLKSIAAPAALAPEPFAWPRADTLLAASTHEGEEEIVIGAFLDARAARPGLRLILAPRHPRRGAAVADLLARRGLAFATRSRGQVPNPDHEAYLADTMGEMARWYAAAGMTFVGGSLTDRGGHTPFEPAAFGSVILHGPHVANFAPAYGALGAAGAAVPVTGPADLAAHLRALSGDGAAQERLAAAARPALARLAPANGLEPFFTSLCSHLENAASCPR